MNLKSIKTMILGIAIMLFGGIWMLSVSGGLSGLIGFSVILAGLIIIIAGFFRRISLCLSLQIRRSSMRFI